jgi:hypothetical protein
MIDTTCPSARILHYVRSNFKFSFVGGTNIETESSPLLEYKSPGVFGEQGDQRQYVFLMYTNPQRKEFAEMQLPAEGETFDVSKFQSDNGLKDPVAGVGMVVRLGGTADCGGQDANELPSGVPTTVRESSSAAVSATRGSSAASVTATSETVQSDSVVSTSSTLTAGNEEDTTPTSTLQTSISMAPSNALQTDEAEQTPAASIATLSSTQATTQGSPVTSGGLLEQTANAAPGTYDARKALFAPLLLVIGVLA